MYLDFSYDTSLSFQGKQRFEYIRIIVIQIIRHVNRFSIKLAPNSRHQCHKCRYVIITININPITCNTINCIIPT